MEEDIILQEIIHSNVLQVCALSNTLSQGQRKMVADNSISLAQALVTEGVWYRAIYKGDTPIGFLMTHTEADEKGETEVFLWRFMIGAAFQGKGYGKKALELLINRLKREGHKELVTSCALGPDSPKGFYESLGFKPNGNKIQEEIVLVVKF